MMKFLLKYSVTLAVLCMLLQSCKEDYYENTGVHNPNFEGSIYDYLVSKPDYFDSLVRVIDLSGMKDVYERDDVTFFAPPAQTLNRSINSLNNYLRFNGQDTIKNLNQIKPETWRDFLSLYTLKEKFLFNDFAQIDTLDLQTFAGQSYLTLSNVPVVVGAVYNDAGGVKYAGYRQLLFAYIRDFNSPYTSLKNTMVASSNIQPKNGVLHVLQMKNHTFGFEAENFILEVLSKGIDY